MLKKIHTHKRFQLLLATIAGVIFGFLLQKGGVTEYDVIMGQLLLLDFTVIKVMLSAVVTGMIGIYSMKALGLLNLHTKPGSFGASVPGGLIFGTGFALLGYCPGTIAGAVGQGSLDALLAGIPGIIIGCGLYASIYPWLAKHILNRGTFGKKTIPELLRVNPWVVILPLCSMFLVLFYFIEAAGW